MAACMKQVIKDQMTGMVRIQLLLIVIVTISLAASDGQEAASGTSYDCTSFPDYNAYISQWRQTNYEESKKMYPLGETYCDSTASYEQRIIGFDPSINFDVPYAGKTFKSLWISPSGFVSLNMGKPASLVPFIWHNSWPNPQYPIDGAQDPSFIAPLYGEADMISMPGDTSKLYYRILDPRTTSNNLKRLIMEGMLNDISQQVQNAVIGDDEFKAKYGFIITWHDVTFADNACISGSGNNCARNTFQLAVVTDEKSTYAVFNYHLINWVGSAGSQKCDEYTGRKSSGSPNCKPGHAGFNAGEGRWFHALPASNKDSLSDIDTGNVGSNIPGRYFYKVSAGKVIRGGCSNDSSVAGPSWPTTIFPTTGGMLGGSPIQVSGPCFTQPERIKCRFGNMVTEAIYIDNIMRVICVAPALNAVGPVKVGVSTDSGNNFFFEADFVVVTPDHIPPEVRIERQRPNWIDPGQIELRWTPEDLSMESSWKVTIKLVGYREDYSSGSPQAVWEDLVVFQEEYSNLGTYLFQPEDYKCSLDDQGNKCKNYDVGAFQVTLLYPFQDLVTPRRVWSHIVPLGWFIEEAMISDRGSDWTSYKCEVWYNENKQTSWTNDLQPCPCTLQQAYTDIGRLQPDPMCSGGSSSITNCERHSGATHCFLSTAMSPIGAGNQCCYDNSNNLMHSGDNRYGSHPQRSHVWGSPPYQNPPRIPELSHWVNDLMGFFYCCEWQNKPNECHERFLQLRPTRSCEDYQEAGQATAFGDPHFLTLDGVFYTFNGYGEYWLMEVEDATIQGRTLNFKLHGRMEQPANQTWGTVCGTYMTAVGMQLNYQDSPEGHYVVVEGNKGGLSKKLLIHIDDYFLDLTQDDLRRQEFTDFIIINNESPTNEEASNFTIVYRCGIGINVAWKNNLIHLQVAAPPQFKGKTRGLFGKWNDDPNDDLEPKDPGGPSFRPDETEKVHYHFGETWHVSNTESCFEFLYRGQLNHDYYNRPWFVPNFVPQFPNNTNGITEAMVQQLCGTDFACTFDYKATLNGEIAKDSKDIQQWDQQRRVMAQYVAACGWLPVPFSIKQQPISYLIGSQVTITGCVEGYTLDGPTVYNCQSTGDDMASWSPQVTTVCKSAEEALKTSRVLWIAIPVALGVVLIIIAIVVVVLVLRRKRKRKKQARDAKQAYVPVFQEIIEWKKGTETNSSAADEVEVDNSSNKATSKKKGRSKKGLADVMNPDGQDNFSIVPPSPEKKPFSKPPRPEPSIDLNQSFNLTESSIDVKHQYDNKHTNSDESNSSKNHVSWDTQDGISSDPNPLKQSTLKSNKSSKSSKAKKKDKDNTLSTQTDTTIVDPSPGSSPKGKRKRPYQYPNESRDHSQEEWPSHNSPQVAIRSQGAAQLPIATYRPRDTHSYTRGHNIPTSEAQTSNYYARKYGKYGAQYNPRS